MRFAAKAAGEAAELERLLGEGAWSGIRDIAHGLAGRAGMFGHGDLGELALRIEESVDAGERPREQLADLIARLRGLDQGR